MIDELRQWWKIICTALLAVGVLFSFLAFVEVLRVFTVLRDAYAPLGYAFLLSTLAGGVWLFAYAAVNIRKRPRVLLPPPVQDLASASRQECREYSAYLARFLRRLGANQALAAEDREKAVRAAEGLEDLARSESAVPALFEEIGRTEREVVEPLLAVLDRQAEAEIRDTVRDVMVGVTLSPFRSGDLLIVVYRNVAMVKRVVAVYNSRPLLAEQMGIMRDVFRVVATVNYMNFGQKLMEQFLARIPYLGRAMDDFAQGIGAGLLTSVAGHGALYRCRAYRRWDQEAAARKMSDHVKGFMVDVRNMFNRDVLPRMRDRLYTAASAERPEDPAGFWDRTTKGLTSALVATEAMVGSFVSAPVNMGATAVTRGKDGLTKGVNGVWRGTKSLGSGTVQLTRSAGARGVGAVTWTGRKIGGVFKGKGKDGPSG